ncbi:hypothetical protein WJU23_01835 [Prosthecobacter sp. SYSU 5D2]|uniref:hypothetical protein n=1 Tax=Prosthecobacter sp. SYSU 5D2 TaxID=3134134 RepID=UPI0031FEA31B
MKKIIAILAVVTGIGFLAPAESSARDYCHNDRRVVSYHSCGTPVYSVYQVYGRDRYGRPLGRWVTQSAGHGSCGRCYSRSSHRGHGHGYHYSGHRPVLPVPPHHRVASSFFFGFGR